MADPRLVEMRRQYGDVYVTRFDNGLVVPWKALSLGEYLKYDLDITRLFIPAGVLEDELFQKCVLDPSLKDSADQLPAGIITTVVQNIWSVSGPESLDQLSSDFEAARLQVTEGRGSIYHQCAQCIATAFSYTLEEVYALDYSTFLLRLAQAEQKMLTTGEISKPLEIIRPTPPPKLGSIPQSNKPKVNAKQLWDEAQKARFQPVEPPKQESRKSPVIESLDRGEAPKIPFAAEKKYADELALDNHEKHEKGPMRQHIIDTKIGNSRQKMVNDAQWIYKDVLDELVKRKKK